MYVEKLVAEKRSLIAAMEVSQSTDAHVTLPTTTALPHIDTSKLSAAECQHIEAVLARAAAVGTAASQPSSGRTSALASVSDATEDVPHPHLQVDFLGSYLDE